MKLFLNYFILILVALAFSFDAEARVTNNGKGSQFSDCNWLVTYRGKTYDLTPLTRETLARPLDSDIRQVIERYPEAAEHLALVSQHTHDAKVHTVIASVSLGGALLTRLFRSSAKTRNGRYTLDVAAIVGGLFFLKGTHESWMATSEAKEELTNAVNTFNDLSPYKIEPAHIAPGIP